MRRSSVLSGVLLLAGILACGGNPPPPLPTPPPTPTPSPSPTPTPTPTSPPTTLLPPVTAPLARTGNRLTVNGQDAWILQAAFCCDSPSPGCWPLVCDFELNLAAEHGYNSVHVRVGPFADEEAAQAGGRGAFLRPARERGVKASGAYAQGLLSKLPDRLRAAAARGVWLEVDLLDGWAAKTGNLIWPDDRCDILLRRPEPRHEAWIRQVVQASAFSPAAYYQVSNESGVCSPGHPGHRLWEFGVRDIVRDELARLGAAPRPIGTNAEMADIDAGLDIASYHQHQILARKPWPAQVNEYNPPDAPSVYLERLNAATAEGTYWTAWRGWPPLDEVDWLAVLAHGKRWRLAHPVGQ